MNVELLRQVMDRIEQEVSRTSGVDEGSQAAGGWNQLYWRSDQDTTCGTVMCFAGWACELSGGKWLAYPYDDHLEAEPDDDANELVRTESSETAIHAMDRATRLLGLTGGQAEDLFLSTNTLADLREQVADLLASAG